MPCDSAVGIGAVDFEQVARSNCGVPLPRPRQQPVGPHSYTGGLRAGQSPTAPPRPWDRRQRQRHCQPLCNERPLLLPRGVQRNSACIRMAPLSLCGGEHVSESCCTRRSRRVDRIRWRWTSNHSAARSSGSESATTAPTATRGSKAGGDAYSYYSHRASASGTAEGRAGNNDTTRHRLRS